MEEDKSMNNTQNKDEELKEFGKYKKVSVIGEGAYGVVYLGLDTSTSQTVAIKKIRLHETPLSEGVPRAVVREIGLLKELNGCENVVELKDVVGHRGRLLLVFEYVSYDLKKYMDFHTSPTNPLLPPSTVQSLSHQLLLGVSHCHARRVIHRDIKPHNILISPSGKLKIADFGLARLTALPTRAYTHEVVTLWYRAPEILFGSDIYGPPVDCWSVGCVINEIATGRPMFTGQSEFDQLIRIMRVLGTPTTSTWHNVESLPYYSPSFPNFVPLDLTRVSGIKGGVKEVVEQLVMMEPKGRLTCHEAKSMGWFGERIEEEVIKRTVTYDQEEGK